MRKKTDISPQIFGSRTHRGKEIAINQKMEELIRLLDDPEINGEKIYHIRQQLSHLIQQLPAYKQYVNHQLADNTFPDTPHKKEALDELDMMLWDPHSKRIMKARNKKKIFSTSVRMIVSILMITLGFAMIVMPAPPYFEMFTIFYFNQQDGFTLMDLISLVIVFCGIFTLITAKNTNSKKEI